MRTSSWQYGIKNREQYYDCSHKFCSWKLFCTKRMSHKRHFPDFPSWPRPLVSTFLYIHLSECHTNIVFLEEITSICRTEHRKCVPFHIQMFHYKSLIKKLYRSQNILDHKMFQTTKCPQSRNVSDREMSTITWCFRSRNVHNHGMSQITKCPQPRNVSDHEMSTITWCFRSWNVHNHGMS